MTAEMEQILNLVWMAAAAAASVAVLKGRHDGKAMAVVVAICSLLFPIVSASDDLAGDRALLDAFAAILVTFAVVLGLSLVFRIAAESEQLTLLALPIHSDPRSPPRG